MKTMKHSSLKPKPVIHERINSEEATLADTFVEDASDENGFGSSFSSPSERASSHFKSDFIFTKKVSFVTSARRCL